MSRFVSSISGLPISAQSAAWAPTNSGDVSAIASAYSESAVSGKMDTSASSNFYPSGNPSGFITGVDLSPYQEKSGMSAYQPSGDYAFNSALSSKLDASASSQFQPSGDYQPSGEYYSASNPSGFITGVDLSEYATKAEVESSVSGKFDASASGEFYPSGNPSGFITGVDLSDYATLSAVESAVSGKMDASASSQFQPSGDYQPSGEYYSASNPSGFITGVDLSDYATLSAVESAVSGKQDASAMTAYQPSGEYYSASNPSGFITGVDLSNYATTAGVESAVSGKLDASASSQFQPSGDYQPVGEYYSASNPSGFITGVDLSDYATTGNVESAVSGKMDASASSNFYPNDNPSGFVTGVDLTPYQEKTGMSSYVPFSSVGVDGSGKVTAVNGSGIAGTDEAVVSGIASAYAESAVSSKMDASASSNFYPSDNPSGFITGVDLSPYQPTSAMTAYQPAGDYQPSGDYYSASNPSGFITGVDLSPYQPVSAMSAYQLSGDYYSGSNPSGFVDSAYVASGLSGKENTFSAGEGLEFVQSGSDRVLQVEAPVDIVAGPGIVIDNPDGNTLRVSVAQNMETVLFSGTAAASVVCSETLSNFSRVRVYAKSGAFATLHEVEFDVADSSVGFFFMAGNVHGYGAQISVSSATAAISNALHVWFNANGCGSEAATIVITKVVGIHRTASN